MYIHVHVAGGFIALEHHLSVFTQGGAYMHNYACTCMCSMYVHVYTCSTGGGESYCSGLFVCVYT